MARCDCEGVVMVKLRQDIQKREGGPSPRMFFFTDSKLSLQNTRHQFEKQVMSEEHPLQRKSP